MLNRLDVYTPFYGILIIRGYDMLEKIKINVTAHTATIINKDIESFEFYKSDGRTFNKNSFITKLIVNYHNTFKEKELAMFEQLKKTISSAVTTSASTTESLAYELISQFYKNNISPNKEKLNHSISIKPTKETAPIIEYIEQYMLSGSTLSEYFRKMFYSYSSLPQDEREKIIFNKQYSALKEAIKSNRSVFITFNNNEGRNCEVMPYAIACAKEELHCYLVGSAKAPMTFRLSRIATVTPLNNSVEFSPYELKIFDKLLTYRVQFNYFNNDFRPVAVQLTERGEKLYKKILIHRPVATKIEGNVYYFECSHFQIIHYFIRFGKDALVLYPDSVIDSIVRFHREATRRYYSAKSNANTSKPKNYTPR